MFNMIIKVELFSKKLKNALQKLNITILAMSFRAKKLVKKIIFLKKVHLFVIFMVIC